MPMIICGDISKVATDEEQHKALLLKINLMIISSIN